MILARHLGPPVTLPLLGLMGLARIIRVQLTLWEDRSRFVVKSGVGSLATLGTLVALRVHFPAVAPELAPWFAAHSPSTPLPSS
mgnify:CR=1 FL=1